MEGNPALTQSVGHGPTPELPIAVKWFRGDNREKFVPPVLVAENRLFVVKVTYPRGSNLCALNPFTGDVQEKYDWGSNRPTAIGTSGSMILVIDFEGLTALDAYKGSKRWQFRQRGMGTPLTANQLIIVPSGGRVLHCIDATTGKEYWRMSRTEQDAGSNPILGNGVIYIRDYDHLLAVDISNGEERWRFKLDSTNVCDVVEENGVTYICSQEYAYAIDARNGAILGRVRFGDNNPRPTRISVINNTAFVGRGNKILAVDPIRQSIRTVKEFDSNSKTEIIAVDEKVIYVHVFTPQYDWHDQVTPTAISRDCGKTLWTYPNHGFVTVSDETVYCMSNIGVMVALGNQLPITIRQDVPIMSAPSSSALMKAQVRAESQIGRFGPREQRDGRDWIEVTIGDVTGWIPLDAIDPATLPPEGEIEYVYIPE